MNIIEALKIDLGEKNVISIVGAGGKTSTMYRLATELKDIGKKVLMTTTTAIYYPMPDTYDNLFISNNLEELLVKSKNLSDGPITVIGSCIFENEKLKGINTEWINILHNRDEYDYILVEADGAKRKSIKAPAWYEPVIPTSTTIVIGCIGLDSIGKPINEQWVHRADIFSRVVGQKLGEVINYHTLRRLVLSKEGLFKGCKEAYEKVILLNKASNGRGLYEAQKLGEAMLKQEKSISRVLIGNVRNVDPILRVME